MDTTWPGGQIEEGDPLFEARWLYGQLSAALRNAITNVDDSDDSKTAVAARETLLRSHLKQLQHLQDMGGSVDSLSKIGREILDLDGARSEIRERLARLRQ